MNLAKLLEMQRELDERIIEKKGLQGQGLLAEKILALQVELGELANEWRGFKFWSENREPRTEHKVTCHVCRGRGNLFVSVYNMDKEICAYCEGTGLQEDKNPLLEEYVDCLHFILSIGLELDCQDVIFEDFKDRRGSVTKQFNYIFHAAATLYEAIICGDPQEEIQNVYVFTVGGFIVLGELLGFTWQEIEQAYFAKNAINHERQNNGY